MGRILLASTGLLLTACYSSVGAHSDAGAEPDITIEIEIETDQACLAGLAECSGRCVDLSSDAANCGACSNTCGLGSECRDGICMYPCPAACYGPSRVCCNDVCVNVSSDNANCGGCWIECPEGSVCRDGRCAVETCPIPCPAGYTCCIDTCVDTSSDIRNCGGCGVACDERISDGCFEGYCSCRGALECGEDSRCCPVGCRHILTDPSNCGDCGTACDIGEICVDGHCMCGEGPACRDGLSCCSGLCIDTSADPLNCGVCNIACDEQGPDCFDGHCACGMRMPCYWNDDAIACMDQLFEEFQLCCDGACVQVGDGNCGECGLACLPEEHCDGVFMFTCQFSCMTDP